MCSTSCDLIRVKVDLSDIVSYLIHCHGSFQSLREVNLRELVNFSRTDPLVKIYDFNNLYQLVELFAMGLHRCIGVS